MNDHISGQIFFFFFFFLLKVIVKNLQGMGKRQGDDGKRHGMSQGKRGKRGKKPSQIARDVSAKFDLASPSWQKGKTPPKLQNLFDLGTRILINSQRKQPLS